MSQSLLKRQHDLASTHSQLKVLSDHQSIGISSFKENLDEVGLLPLKPTGVEIFQVNLGKMCNQVCAHCHVDAGPDRKEIMTRETMELCLAALRDTDIRTVDLTGGAPEMNPHFRWFVQELSQMGKQIIVRCNLTIILANPKYHDLPEFYKAHNVNVVSSLPYFNARRTDAQRGEGVFEKSIEALKRLNAVGYGAPGTGLALDLVYNPAGAFLPGDQHTLESQFKRKLEPLGVVFNQLFCITNLPVSRFLEYLIEAGNYEAYMEELASAFNPSAAMGVMCRNTVSVGWEGSLYDCDFNQMLDLKANNVSHISQWNATALNTRDIIVNQHCYGCTAGAGSSCGGAVA